jgi:hypothetical protein
MTSSKKPRTSVDYSSIVFPTDRITLADIRRVHPAGFEDDPAQGFNHPAPVNDVNTAVYIERLLAHAAFDRALGRSTDVLRDAATDRAGCVEELTQYYRTYGLAEGPQHTEQLVRRIEAQATAQVKRRR